MVLKAYFVVIENTGTKQRITAMPFITDNLCKRAVYDFLGGKINEGLDVIFRAQPFTGRHFEVVADKLFSHRYHIVNDDYLIFGKCFHVRHYCFACRIYARSGGLPIAKAGNWSQILKVIVGRVREVIGGFRQS